MLRLSRLEATLLSLPNCLLLHVLSFWSPQCIATCDSLSTLAWDVDRFFAPWFIDDTVDFRVMLERCGAVVSGSLITQFFDRTLYRDSDMDIFLRMGGLPEMGAWLVSQGYIYSSTSTGYRALRRAIQRVSGKVVSDPVDGHRTIRTVLNFKRLVASTTIIHIQKIQLVVVDMDPIHHVLFDFHSIYHKSYITRNRIESTHRGEVWKSKYRARGFRIISRRSRGDHSDLKIGQRSSMDRRSWIINLEALPKNEENSIYGRVHSDVRFEVMHWRSGATCADSFARIAEPGICRLRMKAAKRFPGLFLRADAVPPFLRTRRPSLSDFARTMQRE
ncbi:hypothetical protein B0H11DRAFT_1910206 [Mycena galericulata]|nr:hypothetical protein B0H11DRAFT_1910206 [Mycena galericulata]